SNFRRAVQMTRGSFVGFLQSLFTNPITLFLLLFIVFMLIAQTQATELLMKKIRSFKVNRQS
ncbi:MAG: hypothetical protein Q8S19_04900, partial [Bacillota bacterium]|nr:hypothetical protein [Bacillota bacterium]